MDLGGWLRSLGLERYEVAFRENEIDETILPKLTAEDLKDLGVSAVGHRRKLLDAIAALGAVASPKAPTLDARRRPPNTQKRTNHPITRSLLRILAGRMHALAAAIFHHSLDGLLIVWPDRQRHPYRQHLAEHRPSRDLSNVGYAHWHPARLSH